MSVATKGSSLRLVLALIFASIAFLGFIALGTWQVQRRAWKLDLIERVEQRVHAAPVVPPAPARWAQVNRNDEYTHVCLNGTFLHDHETLVQAVTVRGAGDWVLTPLQATTGMIVMINRGFVATDQKAPDTRKAGQVAGVVSVCGLLRLTEPRGGFLRQNDASHAKWYSRDVAAIAAAQGLSMNNVAPYFIDADASANPGGAPVGGLTVIHFHNSHLVYAITWYGLALLTLVGVVIVIRHRR